MRFDFYITLPSNASMEFYPDNKTTRFTTRLPRECKLPGEWVAGLQEIQFPQTFSHIPADPGKNYVELYMQKPGAKADSPPKITVSRSSIKSGVYRNIQDLLTEINTTSAVATHLKFEFDIAGHVTVTQVCNCEKTEHSFAMSKVFRAIMGFDVVEEWVKIMVDPRHALRSPHPASLSNALPRVLFVYTDLCESQITGDVQTPLLRVVPIDIDRYEYGSMRLRTFSPPKYMPLLKTSFDTIEIDIRNELGEPILFDHGTLAVTLHFKRID